VVPPVFKTGERCTAALAGSIPVRLRHLRKHQIPRRLRGAPRIGHNGHTGRVLAQRWHAEDDHAYPAASALALRGTIAATASAAAVAISGTTDVYTSLVKLHVLCLSISCTIFARRGRGRIQFELGSGLMGSSAGKGRREVGRAEAAIPAPLVDVYLTVGVRTSDGPGPGHKRVPPGEAAALVGNRRGVYGDQPPRGFEDGGVVVASDAARMMPRRT
jgi:hypothetical protein